MTPCTIEGCAKPAKKRGWCDMHYNRWIRHGDPGPAGHLSNYPPIWNKVDRGGPDGCWIWTGRLDKKGYGIYSGRGAHRRVYQIVAGSIPEGLELDHLCRNRACVNPDHLEPVTKQENLARSWRHRRASGSARRI